MRANASLTDGRLGSEGCITSYSFRRASTQSWLICLYSDCNSTPHAFRHERVDRLANVVLQHEIRAQDWGARGNGQNECERECADGISHPLSFRRRNLTPGRSASE